MRSGVDTTADYYRILGVGPEAGQEEIRAAYRAKLRRWHPDLVTDESEEARRAATEMSARLNEAYRQLSDTGRRSPPPTPDASTPPHRGDRTRPSDHRGRDLVTVGLGGIVAPLIGLAWVSGLLDPPPPANPALIAVLCAGLIAATTWLLTSSRMLRRRDRLTGIGVVWSHLMRGSGWVVIAGGVVLLGIPAIVLTLAAVAAAPFFGLVLIALISGRSDSET